MKIIDVSQWQGVIDWTKVNKSNVGGAIIRGGYGSGHVDTKAHENLTGANLAGIPAGLYWFSYATSEDRAKAEADACLELAKEHKLSLPIYFDFEEDSAKFAKNAGIKVNRDFVTSITKAFCERITQGGERAGYYFNYSFSCTYYDHTKLKAYSKWFAYWSNHIKAGISCDIWQYTDKGKIAGITANVDCNLLFDESLIHNAPQSSQEADLGAILREVIDGKWGNGKARKKALTEAGYDYNTIQTQVNIYMVLAEDIIDGKWGNGSARKKALTEAGYDYSLAQHIINLMLKS